MINKKVPKFGQKENRKCCSMVMCCSWLLILMWIAFLIYCWQSGLVNQNKIKELVNEVDQVVAVAGTNLRHTANMEIDKVVVPNKAVNTAADVVEDRDGDMHVVFSTDCSEYQDWQTLLLFHSAAVVKQKGRITRIASGCTEEQKVKLITLYKTLYPKYGVHFTPDFKQDAKTNKKCK